MCHTGPGVPYGPPGGPAGEGVTSGTLSAMRPLRAGDARCSTDGQDLDAQREALRRLGVSVRRKLRPTTASPGRAGSAQGCVRPWPHAGQATPWW